MSVKHAILGLLYNQPRHGYEIKTEFEVMVHKQWPLNAGQIYSTMDRLVRDGFVEALGEDEKDRKPYIITKAGQVELHKWLLSPVERSLLRDEFFFKFLCAQEIGFPEVQNMISKQKTKIMQTILQVTKLKNTLDPKLDKNMIILLDGSLLHLEADMNWLDMIEVD